MVAASKARELSAYLVGSDRMLDRGLARQVTHQYQKRFANPHYGECFGSGELAVLPKVVMVKTGQLFDCRDYTGVLLTALLVCRRGEVIRNTFSPTCFPQCDIRSLHQQPADANRPPREAL